MKAGDIVQIRRIDAGDHWVYAQVLDAAARRVQIQHPGNAEDGKQLTVAAQDIRTKADVQAVLTAAQAVAAAPLTIAQLQALGLSDAWVLGFARPELGQARTTLHARLVQHYQSQINALS